MDDPIDDLIVYGMRCKIIEEIAKTSKKDLLFRENNSTSKCWYAYCHRYGGQYIKNTFNGIFKIIRNDKLSIENGIRLVVDTIFESDIPERIKIILRLAAQKIHKRGWDGYLCISSLFFLRFISSVIVNPARWDLPSSTSNLAKLGAISNAIQHIVNGTEFEMTSPRKGINDIIKEHRPRAKLFALKILSDVPFDIKCWSSNDVQLWLEAIGLQKYKKEFVTIDGIALMTMADYQFNKNNIIKEPDRRIMMNSLNIPLGLRVVNSEKFIPKKAMTMDSILHKEPSLPNEVEKWSNADVILWLDMSHLEIYKDILKNINGEELLRLAEMEFNTFEEISINHKKSMSRIIKRWPNKRYKRHSVSLHMFTLKGNSKNFI